MTFKIKKFIKEYENNQAKTKIIEDSVRYVEQIYKNESSEEKYKIAEENILTLFKENNVAITDLELKVLIKSACKKYCRKPNSIERDCITK